LWLSTVDPSAARTIRAAVVQMTSGADVAANHRTAARLVRQAAAERATLVVLPETWNLMGGPARVLAGAEDLDGPSIELVRGWARTLGITVVAGSIGERDPGGARTRNTSIVIGSDGQTAGVYRKLHLFDVELPGRSYRESDTTAPGSELCVADVGPLRLGLSVCYDLRFPELYRRLIDLGATAFAVPSAFTARTGRDHWEVLLRARAIEDQVFVLAADQTGRHPDGSESHGHSMIVGPWGAVLAEVPDGEGIAVADLELAELARVRATLPALAHRRRAVFED
jgi:deaminated glutathione amidase